MYEEKTLTCHDCNQEWIYTAEEQEYIANKQYNDPKRCKACRQVRKRQSEERGY